MNPYLKWISARLLLEKKPLKYNLDDCSDEMEKQNIVEKEICILTKLILSN